LIWGLWDVSTEPSPTRFLTRGDYTKGAHAVEPGVIEVLDGHLEKSFHEVAKRSPKPSPQSTGRRLAFAHWLTQPDHPLTARVMVNRIWQYHFWTGIVSTPADFGQRGARPTHPELLDWLAVEFVENGWPSQRGLDHDRVILAETKETDDLFDVRLLMVRAGRFTAVRSALGVDDCDGLADDEATVASRRIEADV
jgi:hypothetical protein